MKFRSICGMIFFIFGFFVAVDANLRIGWLAICSSTYSTDRTGRLTAVVGATSFNGITTYANSPSYDARGRLKGVSYGNGVQMTISTFNNRLRPLTSRSGRARLRSSKGV
ncbi:MAG: hypothetical protein IPK58_08490 [Acidobacteria bacterium]|nr:hypothetical protein [Acidobacteriota bacterium]